MNNFENLVSAWLPRDDFAPEFHAQFYRAMHDDLRLFDEPPLRLHYENHGRSEGRIASPGSHRLGFLAQVPTRGQVLEIGPAVRPALRGDHVRYFEIGNRTDLMARARAEGYPAESCPEIDYVSPTGDLSIVPDTFDAVFSSHCIEHQPDLAGHLDCVASLLKPNGCYFILMPDKRYCFDALLPESNIEEVRAAAKERRRTHTRRSVYDHYVETTHNDPLRHWRGDSADPRRDLKQARKHAADAALDTASAGYVDVHAWQFTPQSFRSIAAGLIDDGLTMRLERIYEPYFGSNEFGAIMSRTKPATKPPRWWGFGRGDAASSRP